jgi:hypothetical protein
MRADEPRTHPVSFRNVTLAIDVGRRQQGLEAADGYFLVGAGDPDTVYVWLKFARPERPRGSHTEALELRLPRSTARELVNQINATLAEPPMDTEAEAP